MGHCGSRHTPQASLFLWCSLERGSLRSAPGSHFSASPKASPQISFPFHPSPIPHTLRIPPRSLPSPRPFPVPWALLPFPPTPTRTQASRILLQAESPREKLTWRPASLSRHLHWGSQDSHPLLSWLHFEESASGAAACNQATSPSRAPWIFQAPQLCCRRPNAAVCP